MQKIIKHIKARFTRKSSQEKLLDFVTDEKNLRKAVEGSMQKREELINRVELKQKRV